MRTTSASGSTRYVLMLAVLTLAPAAVWSQGKPGTDTTPAPPVTKTKLEVQENGGEFASPWVISLTITSADTLAFRYSTNEPAATSAIWQVSDKPFLSGSQITAAQPSQVIPSGALGTVPAPGHVSQFEINFAQFASHTPPKSPKRYYARVVIRNGRNQPVGLPSSSVIITYREPPPSTSFEHPELGSEYCDLSVRHPYQMDRCSLRFLFFDKVDPIVNRAEIHGDHALHLLIKSAAAGKKYQIDCRLDTFGSEHTPYKIYGGKLNETVPQTGALKNVIFIFESTNTDWTELFIRNEEGLMFSNAGSQT